MSAAFSPVVLVHQAVGAFLLPPMCFIWLALLGLWLNRRGPVLLALLLCYLLSTPQMAWWLTRPLEPVVPAVDALQSVQAVVVLGGGKELAPEFGDEELKPDSLIRVRYAAWLARETGRPLLVTGGAPFGGEAEGDIMARTLARDYGVRVRWVERASNTTEENAIYSAPLLRAAGVKRIALVSNAWHLRRATLLFKRQGFEVLPAPTGSFSDARDLELRAWLPSGLSMQQCWTALREWLGLLWAGFHAAVP
ncbi:YdcF family protein [Paludibacterium purpuratum]|uniref:Uncharacterized SAM-binding protein YcdF (DUF218 family) n=1 Tax=Paludibacterium purpuratum TaxID=1144873 RepID=A0A4R7BAS7_9NEIS|nr:YdcF family protein [Paludibacterium purpuratum]TDR82024.1 uncharacterized SAM-binding protein YcdF (DUF218 family) [Paludibacterium purpuratum]